MRLLLIGAIAVCGLRASPVEIESLEPTVLFPKQTPLRQIALLRVYNSSGQPIHGRITVRLDGRGQTEAAAELPPGASQQRVMVPDTESPAKVSVLIADREG